MHVHKYSYTLILMQPVYVCGEHLIIQYCAKLKPLLHNENIVRVFMDGNQTIFVIVLRDELEDNNLYEYAIVAENDIGSNSSLAKNLCKSC